MRNRKFRQFWHKPLPEETLMTLAVELSRTSASFAQELAVLAHQKHLATQQEEDAKLKRQMTEALVIARGITDGLPPFLMKLAAHGAHRAFIVRRDDCRPFDYQYPGYVHPPRGYQEGGLSEYKIRKYLRGTLQKVAFWGLKNGFKVGIVSVSSWEIKDSLRLEVHPFFMPGMSHPQGYIGDGKYLCFRW
ncbi:MAG: hypothetical protein WAW13_04080 [Minisyncoccia bacterium]